MQIISCLLEGWLEAKCDFCYVSQDEVGNACVWINYIDFLHEKEQFFVQVDLVELVLELHYAFQSLVLSLSLLFKALHNLILSYPN